MVNQRAIVEGVIVVFSIGCFVGYHVWLLWFRGRGSRLRQNFHDFFNAGKVARATWAEACCAEEKEGILAVQTARNSMTACSYFAIVSGTLATFGVSILLDEAKMNRIHNLNEKDPICKRLPGDLLFPPTAVLGIALGVLWASFVCFAQSVRLFVHLGYYIRAVPSRFNKYRLNVREAQMMCVKAGMAFTLGLRGFYLFIPLVLWSLGPTALMVMSLCMTIGLGYFDKFEHMESDDRTMLVECLSSDEEEGGDSKSTEHIHPHGAQTTNQEGRAVP